MGCTEILTIIFIVLKLIGTIDWSWWLVLLPELIGLGIYIIVLIISANTVRMSNNIFKRWMD